MTISNLIGDLRQKGIEISVRDDQLAVNGRKDALTADLIEALRTRKPALIAYLKGMAIKKAPIPARIGAPDAATPPLSFAQQRFWFLDQLEPGSASYNMPGAVQMKGALDIPKLHQAFNEVIRRHASLRTTFATVDGEPVQHIAGQLDLQLPLTDLSSLPALLRPQEAQRILAEEAGTPFDLPQGPLIRVRLLRLDDGDHVLLWNLHHIIADGLSMGVMIREVVVLYSAYRARQPSPLPELAVQYADFAHWQRQWLAGEVLAQHLDYWRGQLGGAPSLLALPTDRPRPAVQSSHGALLDFRVDARTTAALSALAQRTQSTLFMVLMAAFQAFLARYSGQDDISVGTPIGNRNRAELEPLIGCFVNTLVIRAHVRPAESFLDLLGQVRSSALGAYAHQDIPFDQLVDALQPERHLGHTPLFQAMLELQNKQQGGASLPDLDIAPLAIENTTAKFDLTVGLAEVQERLDGRIEYNTDLFDASTIERMARHFTRLLDAVAADPGCRMADLPMLSDDEQRQLVSDWAGPQRAHPDGLLTSQMFEAQVERTPDAIAVIHGSQQLSYLELNRRANQLAHHLIGLGIGPDDRVAICCERNVEMVVGLLAIFKAGGAYVPLDADYPANRLAHMLQDSAPRALLTQAGLSDLHALLPVGELPVVYLGSGTEAACPVHNPVPQALGLTDSHLAYVLYTSGSTGKPKGVMIEHRSLVNYIYEAVALFGVTAADTVLQQNSLNFDLSLEEMLPALAVGARLKLATELFGTGPVDPTDSAPTFVHMTAAFWHTLVGEWAAKSALAGGFMRSVRRINITGEALSAQKVQAWQALEATGHVRVINTYGPTETAISCTACDVEPMEPGSSVTIGKPFGNTRAYVLDAQHRPVPIGVAGELYIAGVQVGRGYLNLDKLSAERFLADPFCPQGTGKMYMTGDLVRWLPDGTIDYLGRIDHQVKIRGFRIELGEIETAVAAQPGVRESIVLAREDQPGDKRLVVYLVPQDAAAFDPQALRAALAQSLPDYMVPAHAVVLEALPLTPNGKIDRKALPAPDMTRSQAGYAAPRNAAEATLAALFAEVLALDKVSIHDDFFALGGHSLLATRAVSKIRAAFGQDLPLRALFEAPTVAALAPRLAAAPSAGPATQPIARVERGQDLPLSFSQQRLWFLDQLEPNSSLYNIPGAICLTGALDHDALVRTLDEIVRRHEILRTTFVARDGSAVQRIVPPAPLPLRVIDVSTEADPKRAVREQFEAAAGAPFDLVHDRLIRASLLRVAPDEHVLIFILHHIVTDGWSMGVMSSEFAALYPAFLAQKPSPLPELAIQYADYAHWQHQWLAGAVLEQQLDYWTAQLGGAPTLLTLPTDRPRPAVQSFRGAGLQFQLDAATTAALSALARRHQSTLFMALMATFQIVLARYAGQQDVCVGTPIASRNRPELEPLIGCFINTLVMRAQVRPHERFLDLLDQVRTTALGAFANQDVPFEQLVDALQLERNLRHAPLFQVMLTLQNTPQDSTVSLDGLTAAPLAVDATAAKFDMLLDVTETNAGLTGRFEYSTDLFDATTIERLSGHFKRLLQSVAANPDCRIGELPMLAESERQQLLVGWNDSAATFDTQGTLHQRFEHQAALAPEAIAVVCEQQQLSYAQLNARANQLAHQLRALGVGPDRLVALCAERSVDMVVGLLAILKAGGAYLPLDPAYPADRLAYMLDDAQPAAVLTQRHLLASLPAHTLPCVCIEDGGDSQPHTNLQPLNGPDHLAYVIYTSGSTGKPKGVQIQHRSALNLVAALMADVYEGRRDLLGLRIAVNASFSFDASVQQLMMMLHGATLYMVPQEVRMDTQAMADALRRWKLDGLDCTPSMLSALVDIFPIAELPTYLIVGGEAIEDKLWQRLCQAPGKHFYNAYGPTEATVDSTLCRIDASQPSPGLGGPVANARIYLLDASLNPVPVGVPGELHVAGAGLARGYLNRPALSAEKFIPDPFSGQSGARMYKSGDLARRRLDGTLEYLGRIDNQVKIRGYRIELGEIEAAVAALPGVRESVVLVREDQPGDKRLVAYLVADADGALDVADFRAALLRSLPDYMVPAHAVVLDAMPLTANGKIDRKALRAPETARDDGSYSAPRTPTETALAAIWAELLSLDKVGVADDFFVLGGHSLMAMQLIATVRNAFKVDVKLRELFSEATLGGFAACIDAARKQTDAPIVPVGRTQPLPLSFAQQRLWFLDQLEPGSSLYNVPGAVRLTGALDPDALSRTLDEIVRRHEVLRTTFAQVDGNPIQQIAPPLPLSLPLTDISRAADPAHAIRDALQAAAGTPFDLVHGPLIRAGLLRVAPDEHVLMLTLHHIVTDGWSNGILVKEIAALYGAYAAQQPSPLPELAIQYADYAHWQRQWLAGDVLARQLDYWTGQLRGAPSLLTLPTDRPRPALQSSRGASLPFSVDARTTAALAALAQRTQSTLFMTLMAAFQAFLARYAGQDDISVGTPIANRNRAEIEPLIGCFINTLVMRAQVRPQEPFLDLLDQVRSTALGAYAHQDIPFEQLVDALQPERHLGHTPLFQVMLSLQNTPQDNSIALPGITAKPLAAEGTTAKFDLMLDLGESDGGLAGSFEYNTDLFDASTIERMAGHFARLLDSICADPACRIADLPLLSDAEHQQLLAWNDTDTVFPATGTLHERFEHQAALAPDAIALVYDQQELSYAQLNARANQLAHHLRALGVGPDRLVALCAERSIDMVVGLLAILKAGGAYLPLDPAYPADRLAYMLQDAQPAAVLTQRHLLASLPAHTLPCVCLEDPCDSQPHTNLQPLGGPDHLAYVIYTSGSTGKPKGAAVAHAGIVNRLDWMQQAYQLTHADRVLQKTPYSFDVSVWEFFWPLREGATLVVAKPGGHQDPQYLADLMASQRITTVHFVPPMLEAFLRALPSRWEHALRQVICSGEALPFELQQRFFARFAQPLALHNLYGPTEASVDVTWHACHPSAHGATVPIGKPIANIQIHILDASLQPVPLGVAGELHIAGIGLARGYLNRPALSAEKFIPNPFSAQPGARMYRSGDLARWLPDGAIDYLGRIDNQVKIRGLRIELGEIEAAVAALPGVRESTVLMREDQPGDKRLVAYLVVDAASTFDMADFRAALLGSLPDYMVPAHAVVLDALPLTANGKIDRKALPAPDMTRSETGYVAPRTAMEATLAGVFAEVLSLDKAGVHDSFFALGGHSLLATQVISKIRAAFDQDLPLRALFEAPTVAGLALRLDASLPTGAVETPIVPIGRTQPLPLSFAQQRLWFLDQLEPGSSLYNVPGAVRLTGALDPDALSRTLDEIVRRHEVLRTTFVRLDGVPLQHIAPATPLPLPLTDVSGDADPAQAVRDALQAAAGTPFDLARGPLIRAGLLRVAPDEHVLMLTLHHIVTDGWSNGILIKEIAALYGAYAAQQPSPLPELAIQYADYAHWQRQWLAGDVLARQLDYWTGQLRGAPSLLTLPTDRPRPAVRSSRGASLAFSVDARTTAALNSLAQRTQSTLFMTLMAAFQAFLARYAGQDDISVGTPIANRNRAEIEPLIGCFINTLVMRSQVRPHERFLDLLDQVRGTALGAYAHQDIPFEQLVDVLQPERHLGHTPLFQVMLSLQNTPQDNSIALPGITAKPLAAEGTTAKFDLLVDLAETNEGLAGSFEYNTDLFDTATIERMAAHFTRLLEAVAAEPASRIGELPMLAESERQQLQAWSGGDAVFPVTGTLHQRFEHQAALAPDAIALVYDQQELSYAQLNARANQLAHHLRALGVGPDRLVALCAERSIDMVVGLLAILKAGGAYLPLDPAYPADRLAYMLQDAQPVALLTQRHLLASLPAHSLPCVHLDDGGQGQPDTNPIALAGSQNLAYVIYTSGSTGKPKGALLAHANVLRLFDATQAWFDFDHRDVWTLFHSFAFDFSVWELWGALIHGAKLVVVPHDVSRNPAAFHALLADQRVTVLNQTPAAFQQLIPVDLASARPLSLRYVIFGGEALNRAALDPWFDAHGFDQPALVNMYGITETSVHVTYAPIRPEGFAPASIGRPIPDLACYLLDASLNPVPVGVPGELHVAGAGLARGYLDRPALSAEKFIPNPFSTQPGVRMYRSGDLARRLPDGALEYLGRIDNQVKIRGFRIELGEIEAAVAALPGVRESVVMVREDQPGDKRLVAYLVADTASTFDMADFRAALLRSLPDYMVPAHAVVLDALPLTANGKIDRKALPAPDMTRSEGEYTAPRTTIEATLAGVFAEVLSLDKVGIHDDFFALGGHSLLATQVVSKIRAAFDQDLPLRALFEAPTVAGLALHLDAGLPTGAGETPIVPIGRTQPLPLSFAQQRLWFLDQLEPGSSLYNVPGAVRLTGALDPDALSRTLDEIVRRHEVLRTTFAQVDGNPIQQIAPPLPLSLPLTDISRAADPAHAIRDALQAAAGTPFDLVHGPLIRAGLLRVAPDEHVLMLTLHHIVTDGWSNGILVKEIAALYGAYAAQQPSPLPELAIQYADYAHWQRQWLAGDVLARQLDYWTGQLRGAPSLLTLPTDRPRPSLQSSRGASLPFSVDARTTAALNSLAQRTQSTLFMTLMAAFQAFLARYAGQDDISVGTPIANRNRAEIEPLIGCFINTLVMRAQVRPQERFLDLLDQVRTTALGAYAHQDIPFEQLVDALQPERHLGHTPLFQVMLSLQNTPQDNSIALPGITAKPLAAEGTTAKFDLMLDLGESDGGLAGSFEYNTDLFDTATVERMAAHFTRLLDAVAADPGCRMADLPMLSDDEQRQLVSDWAGPQRAHPDGLLTSQVFEAQVERTPDAIAVIHGSQQLSYLELNRRANQLAHHLIGLGIGPDDRVAICCERNVEMVVGLLAIFKAGGAYVPLDADYPANRLAHMLQDSAPRALLTQAGLSDLHALLPVGQLPVVYLGSGTEAACPVHNPVPQALGLTDSHLAYVLYTSGSTGKPKGVMIEHRSLVNYIFEAVALFGVTAADTVLQQNSLNFDLSLEEMLPALAVGARLKLATELFGTGPVDPTDSAPTFVHMTAAFWHTLVGEWAAKSALAGGFMRSVRRINITGEALSAQKVQAWQALEATGHVRVINTYGPTETAISCTACDVEPMEPGSSVTIGKPFGNTRAYVLDAQHRPVPIGVAGELYIAGVQVGRGYLNLDKLSAERFLADPFCPQGTGKMYMTGDLVRWLPDGTIDYLGRIDHQVKIRGFRIELGEIETAVAAQPGVRESIVLAREDQPGDKRLVVYLVPQDAAAFDPQALRAALAQSLPDYMVPAHAVVLEALPLTPNGKIDRKALPAPDMTRSQAGYAAPRNAAEATLAALFAEVLALDKVSIHDDFFALGGHSLLATRAVSKIRAAFGQDLPLRALFEAPTVAALAPRLAAAPSAGPAAQPIARVERGQDLPLSFSQQRLWFLDQLEPNSSLYNVPGAVRLSGALDQAALSRALDEIVRRHEVLRTSFVRIDGVPLQHIAPATPLPLPLTDVSRATDPAQAVRDALQAAASAPFDLARGPLIRAGLLRVAPDEHVLMLTLHHIVTDGWSTGVLVNEIAALYGAYVAQQPSPLPELAIQYADYAHWQRQWLAGDVLARQLDYWTGQLRGAPSLLTLPSDRPRPAVQSTRGASLPFHIDARTTAALTALSQRTQSTLFMTLMAAFQAFLARYAGQDDISVGTPIANRNRAEIEPLIGCFINTLVMRARVRPQERFLDLLDQVRTTALGAFANQDIPFEQLVDALQPERHLGHTPLFQVMLSLQNTPQDNSIALPGITAKPLAAEGTTAKFDLLMDLAETDDGLAGNFEYNTDLFDAATIERMAGHFARLLASICADPACRIADLPLLGEAELEQLLVGWNDTATPFPAAHTVQQCFERQAAVTPDATALVLGDRQLGYAELNARANRLAHRLRALGVGPDRLVAVCAERSFEMVVGLLAILKAGGAYLPLDPGNPAERLAYLLQDAAPAVVLAQRHLLALLPPHALPCVLLEDGHHDLADTNPAPSAGPDNVAYVNYTSGSTGKPKGVQAVHRGVTRLVCDTDYCTLTSEDRILQFAPIWFDAATFEIWGALLNGATLVIFPARFESLGQLAQVIGDSGITTLWLTAAMFNQMVDHHAATVTRVAHVLAGGEALSASHVQRFLEASGGRTRLTNGYGPTENTTFTCCHAITQASLPNGSVPIGAPIANTQVYILDADMAPVPIGVAGELHAAGHGLARGYLNRPDLSAEKFVPNPFSSEPGGRMYRTGDLARWLPDGSVEFLGRIDNQIKIRGFRIELGEIEAAVDALPGVRESVVLMREDQPGDKRLVAYLVADAASAIDLAGLRAALLQSLPEYMVPAHVVALERLPLTANGKIDRKALPAPDTTRSETGHVAPRTDAERALADIWADVLSLDKVGIHDDFFALGGHSLLATQAISKIRAAFDQDLPLRALFEAPTVAGLAERLEAGLSTGPVEPTIVPVGRDQPLPLSFAQQRLWFLDQLQPNSAFYNVPGAVRLSGALDPDALSRALDEIVRRHDVLRTTFVQVDGNPVQQIAPPVPLPLPLRDVSGAADPAQAVRDELQATASAPFDLARGPLIRAGLLRVAPDEHVLMLTLHHIVTDGWSNGIIVKEIAALYGAYAAQQPSPLPELAIQYADYAHWQRQWLAGDVLARQLDYWTGQLRGAPSLLTLPTDRPRPALQSFRGTSLPFRVDARTTAALAALAQRTQSTLFMTLMAAFQAFLARYAGQDDISVGTPIANRNRAEIEPLIGCFVNTLVMRAQVRPHERFLDLLDQVRSTALGAYAHQDIPFEQLVDALQPERHLGHTPLFQVMLSLQNTPEDSRIALPGVTAAPLAAENTTAKFDLLVDVTETDGGLAGSFEYNTDLFDAATIERMAGHFTGLLASIAADPACRIANLAMLAESERQQLLDGWNDSAATFDTQGTLHQRFERQAALAPEAIAVVCEQQQLSYAQLNARANQLAHQLRALGVGPDRLVALCAERSVDMVVGLLAILKAGGAYLPLDPAYPADRLAYMLDDAQPAAVLTQRHLLASLPAHTLPCVCIEDGGDSQPHTNLQPLNGPDHLAYVIYTSGSTGKPKGVQIQHRSALNLVAALMADVYEGRPDLLGLRIAVNASFSFDASVQQLMMMLHGATLYMVPQEVRMDTQAMADALRRWKLDGLDCTPSMLSALVDLFPITELPTYLIVGGEAIEDKLWQRLCQEPGKHFYNAYGPTEATVDSTLCRIDASQPSPCLGGPVANARIYLLDASLNPVPVGVPGELHVAGAGLARGYLDRPALSAEKFIPDPFSGQSGARMYKSGDLARRRLDGTLEYLGRIDNQVKIRGYRIELGEIEAAVAALPGVRESVVLVREDQPGDKRLVAYLVADADGAIDVADLRAALLRSLPDYMVPAHAVVLDALPLTANGKIDRKTLPAPDVTRSETGYVAPRTATERTLADIWAAVLSLDKVGIHDDFFALGGHSLLAVRLIAMIKKRLKIALPLATLFMAPTIAQFAEITVTREGPDSLIVPLNGDQPGGHGALFCLHPIGGSILPYRNFAQQMRGHAQVYGIQAPEMAGIPLRFDSIEAMAEKYAQLIIQTQPAAPYRLIGWSSGGLIALAVASVLERHGKKVEYVGLIDTFVEEDDDLFSEEETWTLAALSTLSAIRGNALAPAELVEIKGQLDAVDMSISDLFEERHVDFALPFLHQWTNEHISLETLKSLETQVNVSKHYLSLLSRFKPRRLASPIHMICPEDSPRAPDVHVEQVRAISDHPSNRLHLVGGHHYTMLDEFHVAVAEHVVSAIRTVSVDNEYESMTS